MVELIFMLLILKLPILYLAGVCYYAIRAEPKPLDGAGARVDPEPGPRSSPERRRPGPPRPHGRPTRREARTARAAGARPTA